LLRIAKRMIEIRNRSGIFCKLLRMTNVSSGEPPS